MLRTTAVLTTFGCLLLTAGCGTLGAGSTAPSSSNSSTTTPAKTASTGTTTRTPSTSGSSSTATPAWTCSSPAPPASTGSAVVVSPRTTVGSEWVEAAGLAAKGCVTVYVAPANTANWRAESVTSDASGGNGVSALQVAAVDGDHIFVLATGLPGAGQAPAFLFGTNDGGKAWTDLASDRSTKFPSSNVRLNMLFTSATDGWITDLNAFFGPPRVEVYHTTDGGRDWTLNAFSVPQKYAQALGGGQALPPVWQRATQGTLKVTGTMNGTRTTLFYGTSDGGATWLLEGEGGS